MNKQREKTERLKEAVSAQKRHFAGKAGSAKNLAHEMLFSMVDFADGPAQVSSRLKGELLELSRPDMTEELASCDSALFRQITSIATALRNRDSKFFRDIASGLEQLPSKGFDALPLDEIGPMQFLHRAFMSWTHPTDRNWFGVWTLPAYQKYVQKELDPTKQQMRELTLRFWAIDRLTKKETIDLCDPTEEQPPAVEIQIAKEMARLPEQKWSRIWKTSGLSHLRAGRPGPKSE